MLSGIKRVFILALAWAVLVQLPGCAGPTGGMSSGTVQPVSSAGAVNAPASAKPLVELTSFSSIMSELDLITGGDLNSRPIARELTRRTGVTFNYILSTPEDAQNKLRLLISSRDIPDVFADGGFDETYPGGASRAAADGIIVKLNPYLDTLAPNYKRAITLKPEYEKNVIADNGDIYGFSCFRGSKESTVFFGPMIRKDILDKAGVPVPETIDEWHTALMALKDYGCKTPLVMLDWYINYSGAFIGAFGCCTAYYVGPDKNVHFGAMEDGYKRFLQLFHFWFSEGLIDPDYLELKDQAALDVMMINGKAGASLNFISRIKKSNDNGRTIIPDYNVVATKYPVLNRGDTPMFAQADNPVLLQYFVGATGNHIEDAIRWYDYGYSDEGQMLYNFGILGESYTMVGDRPVYTEMVTKDPNPKGWNTTQSRLMYLPIASDAPTVESMEYFKQLALATPEQKNAAALWGDALLSSQLPPFSFTAAEQDVIRNQVNIDTYVSEVAAKIILGEWPLSQWDEYITHLRELGVDEMLRAYNSANDRYNNRQH